MKKVIMCMALVSLMACEEDEQNEPLEMERSEGEEGKGGCRTAGFGNANDICPASSDQSPGPWVGCDGSPVNIWTQTTPGNENGQACTFLHSFPPMSNVARTYSLVGENSGPIPALNVTSGNGDPVSQVFVANLGCGTQEMINVWEDCGSYTVHVGRLYDACGEGTSNTDENERLKD